MSGDPKVLAPLQQAYRSATDERVQNAIIKAWAIETGQKCDWYFRFDALIRGWDGGA